MPNMHKIDITSELWPKRGEKLKYIRNSTSPTLNNFVDSAPILTCGEFYEIMDIRLIPCKDQILIYDDKGSTFWIDLKDFNFQNL